MKYRSRTGFGDVNWPWWHDALIITVVFILIAIAAVVL